MLDVHGLVGQDGGGVSVGVSGTLNVEYFKIFLLLLVVNSEVKGRLSFNFGKSVVTEGSYLLLR